MLNVKNVRSGQKVSKKLNNCCDFISFTLIISTNNLVTDEGGGGDLAITSQLVKKSCEIWWDIKETWTYKLSYH